MTSASQSWIQAMKRRKGVDMSRTLVWIDTETSGLKPNTHPFHRVIEIAVSVTDVDLNIIEEFETKIRLSAVDRANASPKALEVNHYTDEEWADAVEPSRSLWQKVLSMTKDRAFAGQNPKFDEQFLVAELQRFGLASNWMRRLYDTTTLAHHIMWAHDVKGDNGQLTASLVPVYKALGAPELPEHRAMADVKRAQYLYRIFKDGFYLWQEKQAALRDGDHS